MKRRDATIALLALGVVPFVTKAQDSRRIALIGWLGLGSAAEAAYLVNAFKQGLREHGYVEGKDFVFEARWGSGRTERLPGLAKELVALKPDVILATYAATARPLLHATSTIPIVTADTGDPGRAGVVKNIARPEANITGFFSLTRQLAVKRLELLMTVVPNLARVGVMWNSAAAAVTSALENLQVAARNMRIELLLVEASSPAQIPEAISRIARENVTAVIVLSDALYIQQRHQIVDLIAKARLVSAYDFREDVEAGGLMSYGEDLADRYRRTASYVDKILKGAKVRDLPVEQASKLELVVNLKSAKALGLTIPQSVLLRADRVIK